MTHVRHVSGRRRALPHISALIPELWALLSETDREAVLIGSTLQEYEPGEVIYPHPDTSRRRSSESSVALVVRGQALTYDPEHPDIPLRFAGSEILGLSHALTGSQDPCFCRALSRCLALSICSDTIQSIIDHNPAVTKYLLAKSLTALSERDMRLIVLHTRHMPGRMAATLIYLDRAFGRESDGKTLRAKFTRCILGGLSDMTTSNATRVLRSFQEDGIVGLNGRAIEILQERDLAEVCRHG